MAGQAFPFCAWPPRCLPGCHFPGLSHGHRVYRGQGGLSRVDLTRPVGYAQAGSSEIRMAGLGHDAPGRYTYLVRPVSGSAWLETPDFSCACELEFDEAGQWLGARPAGVEWLSAEVASAGRITVRWFYRTPPGGLTPTDFAVYCSTSPTSVPGEPTAVVAHTRDGSRSHTLQLEHGSSYWFTVTARAGEAESTVPRPVGPFVADASAPAVPTVLLRRAF